MTNDESFSNSYGNAPKRPDIPPPSGNNKYVRPSAIKNKANTYVNGQAFYDELGYNSNNNQSRQQPHTTEDLKFVEGLARRYESQFVNANKL